MDLWRVPSKGEEPGTLRPAISPGKDDVVARLRRPSPTSALFQGSLGSRDAALAPFLTCTRNRGPFAFSAATTSSCARAARAEQPVGALLLEHCRVTQEEPTGFSISFVEDPERKYHFECCSEEQCQQWMGALRQASYEFMRRSLIFYRNEIQKMTGKDPLEQFGISEEARFQLSGLKA
ncbi:Pleckstrin like proteiny domain-containing family J member 1 [Pteropus alecto]|uniref:Pleckstrin homology domain-containing family J member 1 n=1 Tax=Pteropus alecto TaxID=9402 RepID=L5L7D4_PTEAL|nr:Pleckstrin like proteiny domain-containing family J member 1 [Pteropus alecto]